MTKKTEIEIHITEEGNVECTVKGLKGKGCLVYEELLASLLGNIHQRTLTSEYYEEDVHIAKHLHGKVRRDGS